MLLLSSSLVFSPVPANTEDERGLGDGESQAFDSKEALHYAVLFQPHGLEAGLIRDPINVPPESGAKVGRIDPLPLFQLEGG